MNKALFVAFVVLSFLVCLSVSEGQENTKKTAEYYDLVEDIISGVTHYETLEIEQIATQREIKKAFHSLSLKYHPDKIKTNFPKNEHESALQRYYKILRAYEVLSSTTLKEQYDGLLKDGIPWQDRHYHRYVHQFWRGAPQHDPLHVIFWFVLSMTIFHYYYVRFRYNRFMRYAKRSQKYKQAVKTANTTPLEGDVTSDEPKIMICGLPEPKWYEILPLVIVTTSFSVSKQVFMFLIAFVTRKKLTSEELELEHKKRICEKYGWSDEEYEEQVQKSIRKQQQLMNSTKMKKYLRYKKKHGIK